MKQSTLESTITNHFIVTVLTIIAVTIVVAAPTNIETVRIAALLGVWIPSWSMTYIFYKIDKKMGKR